MTAIVPSRRHYQLQIVEANSPIRKILADIRGFSHWVGCGVHPLHRHLVVRVRGCAENGESNN